MLKKIAIYTKLPPSAGGSFQYGASILAALKQLDTNEYCCHFWCTHEAWLPIAQNFNINTTLIAKPGFLSRLKLYGLRKFRQVCKLPSQYYTHFFLPIARWNPDICISLTQDNPPLQGCKIIGPIHDLMHRYEARFPEVGEASEYCSREQMFSTFCRTAAAILVDSNVGKQHVSEIYHPDPEKIFILPFIPSPLAEKAEKPQNFPLAEGQKYLFYPAQLWLHKNHANLLRAVKKLLPELDIHCIFTGTTDKSGAFLYNQLLHELDLEKNVHHLGYVSDNETRWLYEHARCMIMPSFFGPTNIPPLEAMLAGCPVAVSDIYAMRERYGDASLYFDPHNVTEIAAVIQRLWTDDNLCQEMIKHGYAQASTWTQTDFEARFLDILHHVENF